MKLKIDHEEMMDRFYDETRLMGIVAPVEAYKFCWQINRLLNFDFRIVPEMELSMKKKGRRYFFSMYVFNQPSTSAAHFLYSNHCGGEFLLPELKHFDYLWLIKFDTVDEAEMRLFINSLRSIPLLQMVTELSIDKIKNKENLFF